MTGRGKQKAFTLIELLVVIAVIALLLSILIPALSKAKRQALTTICTTRTRHIAQTLAMYVIDYSGKLPPSYATSPEEAQQYNAGTMDVIWLGRIASYYGKDMVGNQTFGMASTAYDMEAFRCPTQEYYLKLLRENPDKMGQAIDSPKTPGKVSLYGGAGTYGYNIFFSGRGAYTGGGTPISLPGFDIYNHRQAGNIKNSSSLPMACDMAVEPYFDYRDNVVLNPKPNLLDIGGWLMVPFDPHPAAYNYGWRGGWCAYGPAALHDGKINYVYADGHSEAKKMWPWNDIENGASIGKMERMRFFDPQPENGKVYW